MSNGRAIVEQSSFEPLPYGLLSVATDRSASAPNHWAAGVTWDEHCPAGSSTFDRCLVLARDGSTESTTTAPTPASKGQSDSTTYRSRGAVPFTVVYELDCSTPGFWDQSERRAREGLVRDESRQVEAVLSQGVTGASSTAVVWPHLAADTALVDTTGAILQLPATTPLSGTATDIVSAVRFLERGLASCYGGVGVIHVPAEVFTIMDTEDLVRRDGGALYSPGGHRISVGAGYTGGAPDGSTDEDEPWIYGTGPVWFYRGDVTVFDRGDSLDRSVNTVQAIAERTYVVGYDCCLFGVAVDLGEV